MDPSTIIDREELPSAFGGVWNRIGKPNVHQDPAAKRCATQSRSPTRTPFFMDCQRGAAPSMLLCHPSVLPEGVSRLILLEVDSLGGHSDTCLSNADRVRYR